MTTDNPSMPRNLQRTAAACVFTLNVLLWHASGFAQEDRPVEVEVVEAQAAVVITDLIAGEPIANRNPEVLEKNLIAELRPILYAELYFLGSVVEIDRDTRKKIKEQAETRLESMGELIVNENVFNGLERGFNTSKVVAQTSTGISLNDNPYSKVQSEVKQIASQHLNEQQFAEYCEELEQRLQFRRDANAGMVVFLLDRHLSLTVEQRKQIHDNLVEKWKEIDNVALEMYANNRDYVPVLPFPLIDEVLNREQRTIWRGLNQYHFPMTMHNPGRQMDWEF